MTSNTSEEITNSTAELLCREPEETRGDEVTSFDDWLNRPLVKRGTSTEEWYVGGRFEVEDFMSDAWYSTTLRDRMNNDLSLYDSGPEEFLVFGEIYMDNLFCFPPDQLDWRKMFQTTREEWHAAVRGYYQMLYELEFLPCGWRLFPSFHSEGGKGLVTLKNDHWLEWCPALNALYDERRRRREWEYECRPY